jgi:flagellar basal-body rod modification protein FlgD
MTVTATAAPASTSASSTTSSISSLTTNFGDFLNLLMTQLQHQDPTSPMDTNAFTGQLVQYASVEQQINANSNLTKLIQATQSNTMLQAGSLVGRDVQVSSDHVSVQQGVATAQFTAPAAGQVSVGVYSGSGAKLSETAVQAKAGVNAWSWDGKGTDGKQVPDGSYKLVVQGQSGTALPTTAVGTVTGMSRSGDAVNVSLGALTVPINDVQAVGASGG